MKRLKHHFLTTATLTSMLLLPDETFGQGAVIFDDFLFDNASMPQVNLSGFPAQPGFLEWTVTDGSVDLVGSSILNPPGDLFGRYVDLGGSTGDAGLFAYALPISLLPNVPYTLSFFFNSVDGQANSASVRFVDEIFNVSSNTATFASFTQDFTFTNPVDFPGALTAPPSASPLTFQDLDNDNSGIGIDRVMVTQVVPEPTSAALVAGGLLALSGCRRRQRVIS